MCWNIPFSLGSLLVGWVTCLYLHFRKRSPRDVYYRNYLFTFTFTQIVDIYLWWQHGELAGGLQACPAYKEQFFAVPEGAQRQQYIVSKFILPLVVISQHLVQLSYPSDYLAKHRRQLLAVHLLPALGMCFGFACTDVVTAAFPAPHETLRWGGHTSETWQVLIVVAVVCLDFVLIVPEKSVLVAHVGVFLCVVYTLWATEGTLALGSKWCTYCLIFSAVYTLEPFWGPPAGFPEKGKIQ